MWKVLIFGVAAFLLWKMLTGDFKYKKKKDEASEAKPPAASAKSEMVKDPVCGSFVSTAASVQLTSEGLVHHFCSRECRDAFAKQIEVKSASTNNRG